MASTAECGVMVRFKNPQDKEALIELADQYGMSASQALVSMAKIAVANNELSLQRNKVVYENTSPAVERDLAETRREMKDPNFDGYSDREVDALYAQFEQEGRSKIYE